MIDRTVVASMTVGAGIHTAAQIEDLLDTAEQTAADIARHMIRPRLPAAWHEFVVDALVAAQFAAHADTHAITDAEPSQIWT